MTFQGDRYEADFHVPNYYPPSSAAGPNCLGLQVYLPDPARFPRPVGGYPVVYCNVTSGYIGTYDGAVDEPTDLYFITPPADPQRWACLERGVAIVGVSLIGPKGSLTQGGGNGRVGAEGTDVWWSGNGTASPDQVPYGTGLVHPPGVPPSPGAPGKDGWQDVDQPNPFKDLVWAIQYCREHAGELGVSPLPSKSGTAGTRGWGGGGSASATVAAFPVFSEDLADRTATDQRRQSTWCQVYQGGGAQFDFTAFNPTKDLDTYPGGNVIRCFASTSDYLGTWMDTFQDARDSGEALGLTLFYYGFKTDELRKRNGSEVICYLSSLYSANGLDISLTGNYVPGFAGEDTGESCKMPAWGADDATTLYPGGGTPSVDSNNDVHAAIVMYYALERLREVETDGWHTENSRLVVSPDVMAALTADGLDVSWVELDNTGWGVSPNQATQIGDDIANFFVAAFAKLGEIPRQENTLTVEDVLVDIENHLDGPLEASVPAINVVNEAGEAFVNSHPWKFLQGASIPLDIIADQEYIDLPDDFAETITVHATNSLVNSIQLTNLDELLRFRTYPVQATTFYTYAALAFRRKVQGGSPQPVLELWPIPVESDYGRHTLFYRAGWQRVQDDADIVSVPIWLWTLYKQFARVFAMGYSEEHEVSLAKRLEELRVSQLFLDAVRRDSVHQDTFGQITGGNVEGMYMVRDWGINNRVMGPS